MYTTTSFARLPSGLNFKRKASFFNKQEISPKMEAKNKYPWRINCSNVGLCSEEYSLRNINTDTYTLSHKNVHAGTKRTVDKGHISKLNFQVRSYETNADAKISHATILNYLQEGCLDWIRGIGLFDGRSGLARTPKLIKQNLIWVVAKTRVKIDQYPSWNDMVQVNTWFSLTKRGGFACNSTIHDAKTGEILIRASILIVTMSIDTRRLCKIPGEIKAELEPCCLDASPFVNEDNTRVSKLNDNDTADVILKTCTPRWTDIDFNEHVNNAKYICWLLENVPTWLALNYEITSVAIDYRRECTANEALQSLVAVTPVSPGGDHTGNVLESQHLIRFEEDQAEIVRARLKWKPRS